MTKSHITVYTANDGTSSLLSVRGPNKFHVNLYDCDTRTLAELGMAIADALAAAKPDDPAVLAAADLLRLWENTANAPKQ